MVGVCRLKNWNVELKNNAKILDPGNDQAIRQAWKALEGVSDPEIPVISVVEMGIIANVSMVDGQMCVAMTPTFAGCPALEVMKHDINEALRAAGFANPRVDVVFEPPWTSDRISRDGLRKLQEFGLAPPERCGTTGATIEAMQKVPCPLCGSTETTLESIFGPTLCRAIHYCNTCQQSFEQFKPV